MLQTTIRRFNGLPASDYLPCISLIMPFEPTMNLKTALAQNIKTATDKIGNELLRNYPADEAIPLMEKLTHLIKELNYNTHKKTIAIFVSPLFEKVYYLDLPVTEKIMINQSFEIRDLIYSKKEAHKYLLAVLGSDAAKVYIGNNEQLIPIVVNICDNITGCKKQASAQADATCEASCNDQLFDKFLQHTDKGLHLLLQSYPLPLFIMGAPKTIGQFKALTHTADHVIEYIPGDFETKTETELHQIMDPYVADWKKVKHDDLLHRATEALKHKKLFAGIKEVWKAAVNKRVRLLIVEKNFVCPAQTYAMQETGFKRDEKMKDAFYIKDMVDDVIEKVLANGGDVEFVDDGLLKDYQRIALIEVYDEL